MAVAIGPCVSLATKTSAAALGTWTSFLLSICLGPPSDLHHSGTYPTDTQYFLVPYWLVGGLFVCSAFVCPSVSPSVSHAFSFPDFSLSSFDIYLKFWIWICLDKIQDQVQLLSCLTNLYIIIVLLNLLKFTFFWTFLYNFLRYLLEILCINLTSCNTANSTFFTLDLLLHELLPFAKM